MHGRVQGRDEMDEAFRWAGLLVTLVTLGLIPWAVSRNTKQHNDGQALRDEIRNDVKEIKADVAVSKRDILDMKADDITVKNQIFQLREERMLDREFYFGLLKQVKDDIHEISRAQRMGYQPTEDVPGAIFGGDNHSGSS